MIVSREISFAPWRRDAPHRRIRDSGVRDRRRGVWQQQQAVDSEHDDTPRLDEFINDIGSCHEHDDATGTTTTPQAALSIAVWPTAASSVRYHDPVAVARAFAINYLHFVNPIVGQFQQGDTHSGEVPIHTAVRGPSLGPVTTVIVRRHRRLVVGPRRGDAEHHTHPACGARNDQLSGTTARNEHGVRGDREGFDPPRRRCETVGREHPDGRLERPDGSVQRVVRVRPADQPRRCDRAVHELVSEWPRR